MTLKAAQWLVRLQLTPVGPWAQEPVGFVSDILKEWIFHFGFVVVVFVQCFVHSNIDRNFKIFLLILQQQ